MTEKRFTHRKWIDGNRELLDNGEPFAIVDTGRQSQIVCDKLNELAEENEQLKQEIKGLNDESDTFDRLYSAELDIIKKLRNENEQLQARNDRQANSLDELYNLIEKQDWEALKQIIQDFKDSDEQLRKEWKCYE